MSILTHENHYIDAQLTERQLFFESIMYINWHCCRSWFIIKRTIRTKIAKLCLHFSCQLQSMHQLAHFLSFVAIIHFLDVMDINTHPLPRNYSQIAAAGRGKLILFSGMTVGISTTFHSVPMLNSIWSIQIKSHAIGSILFSSALIFFYHFYWLKREKEHKVGQEEVVEEIGRVAEQEGIYEKIYCWKFSMNKY